jgi:hypothetical protein
VNRAAAAAAGESQNSRARHTPSVSRPVSLARIAPVPDFHLFFKISEEVARGLNGAESATSQWTVMCDCAVLIGRLSGNLGR